jgi:hypothetical protein
MPKTIAVGIALLLGGLALGARGFYVWTGCGYDCPALSYPNTTATAAILYGAISALIGFGVLMAALLGGNRRGN